MKIERINENSIRCVLTNFDLNVRNIKVSELTYGSEKARDLFREMMRRASNEVGFDAEDIPLMVEAIPMPNDSIMLIITKIDDPEELDTRFSKFSPDHEDDDNAWNALAAELLEGADGLLNLLENPEMLEKVPEKTSQNEKTETVSRPEMLQNNASRYIRIYQFETLDLVCAAAKETNRIFTGSSVLYKNPVNGKFYLVLKHEGADDLAFSRTCNLLSEYAIRQKHDPATEAYYSEHYEVFVKKNALQALARL